VKRRSFSRECRPSRQVRRGTATVELAITVGLAFFFFFAALEFSRVAMIRHSVENALYEGARKGIVPGTTPTEIRTAATGILRTVGISGASIDVSPATIQNDTPEVSVRIRVPLDRGLFAPAFFFLGKSLDRTMVMQREGFR
jgi:Flp pilus assembly protein TadG